MPAHEYLNGEQLSMFLPAKKLIELPPNPWELGEEINYAEDSGFDETPKQTANRLWASKLEYSQQDPEPGGATDAGDFELPKKYNDNLDLYDSIQKHGVINPVPLGFTDQSSVPKTSSLLFGKSQYVIGGHHRIAAAKDINPNMEIPVMYWGYLEDNVPFRKDE